MAPRRVRTRCISKCFSFTLDNGVAVPTLNRIERRDDGCLDVHMGKGTCAVIDARYLPVIVGLRWSATRHVNGWYAHASLGHRKIYMHKLIAAELVQEVDHRDRDTLNNRRGNLRRGSHSQNCFNRRAQSNNHSGFKGVSFDRSRNKWAAEIQTNGHRVRLGRFPTREAAAAAYAEAAKKYHGEFARTE